MSKQSNVGRILIDVRDVCAQQVVQTLVYTNKDKSLNLSQDQLTELSSILKASINKSFDAGIDAVLKLV